MLRRTAVAGSWYPASRDQLRAQVDEYLERADQTAAAPPAGAALVGLVAPHAGLIYSGPVAAYAYRLLRDRSFDMVVLVGPSHFVPFEGVSIWPTGAFETPFGPLAIDEAASAALLAHCPVVTEFPKAHAREHSLEMQLPFLAALTHSTPILPLVMGRQTRATAFALAEGLVQIIGSRRALLVASSDLSHYFDAPTAARLDATVINKIETLDGDGLMDALERRSDLACGGGPIVTTLRAARALGATSSQVLRYADSGDVSGDKSAVVGYVAAAMWK
jgi:AmmeMemoRadiSam system protein B